MKKLFALLLILFAFFAVVFCFGRFVLGFGGFSYDSFDEMASGTNFYYYVDPPESAYDCKFYKNNIAISKYCIYAFSLPEEDYDALIDDLIKEYHLEEEETEENIGTQEYRKWYLTKVRDAKNPDYELDDFPFSLEFDKVIDDDIKDYDIILNKPQGCGSSSSGLVVNPSEHRIVCFNYASFK